MERLTPWKHKYSRRLDLESNTGSQIRSKSAKHSVLTFSIVLWSSGQTQGVLKTRSLDTLLQTSRVGVARQADLGEAQVTVPWPCLHCCSRNIERWMADRSNLSTCCTFNEDAKFLGSYSARFLECDHICVPHVSSLFDPTMISNCRAWHKWEATGIHCFLMWAVWKR